MERTKKEIVAYLRGYEACIDDALKTCDGGEGGHQLTIDTVSELETALKAMHNVISYINGEEEE